MTLNRAASRTFPPITLSLFAAATIVLAATPALAQSAAPAATHVAQKSVPDAYVEGQIAFFKAALEITPAQEARWNKVATAMRNNNSDAQQVYDELQSAPEKTDAAVQRIKSNLRLAELSVREGKRFLDAFLPLYASLSKDQKTAADALIGQSAGTAASPPPPNEPPPTWPGPVAR